MLIAACDTFRAGAVEQLRTHTRKLNALHPPRSTTKGEVVDCVNLYEKGYGKDPAGIAAEAISFARENKFDVALIDTAGRMQDNEPLMKALGKVSRFHQIPSDSTRLHQIPHSHSLPLPYCHPFSLCWRTRVPNYVDCFGLLIRAAGTQ